MKSYLDFDLLIEKNATGYRARVLNSPAGQASHEFSLPFSELELENFLLRIGQPRQGMRRLESTAMGAAKQFGGQLFQALFAGEIKSCFQSSLDEAGYHNAGLRIRLRLSGAPELLDIPWEFLYNATLNRFLLLSIDSPLVRYLDLPMRVNTLKVTPPFRILVMIANPRDYVTLDVEREWQLLKQAVAELERDRLLVVERLDRATLSGLQKQLQRADYHIFHFIGHGSYDAQTEDGVLLLEDESGKSRMVSGQRLGMLLHDTKTLRLALLNSCEGARTARTDPFAGVCQSLLQQGIPAVLAMQFAISDKAAITLACEFYTALAAGLSVDTALTAARKGIFASHNDIEWGTPVLYMRTPTGQIFDVIEQPMPQPPPLSEDRPQVAPPVPKSALPVSSGKLTGQRRRSMVLWWLLVVVVGLFGLWQLFPQNEPMTIAQNVSTPPIPSATPMSTPIDTQAPGDAQPTLPAGPVSNFQRPLLHWYDTTSGITAMGYIANDDRFQQLPNPGELSAGWTHAVYLTDRMILMYDANRGAAVAVRLNDDGQYETVASYDTFATGWTNIVYVGDNRILFYRASDGLATLVVMNRQGELTTLYSGVNDIVPGWSEIVYTEATGLFFYNETTGTGEVGTFDSQGNYQRIKVHPTYFSSGWTHIVYDASNQTLVYYNQNGGSPNSGFLTLGKLDNNGNHTTLGSSQVGTGWTHLVALDGNLLLYNAVNTDNAVAQISPTGEVFITRRSAESFQSGWTTIVYGD